jgi:ubiquinone/menaquinone biosynthesis C-methylase UbiE
MSTNNVLQFYNSTKMETDRLEKDVFKVEGIRSRIIIEEYLSGKMTIGDIGGATGVYSFWLHDKGHTVHLLDPSEYHISEAKAIATRTGKQLASIQQGDARSLPYPDNSFDLVLLFGPLYHLLEKEDRIQSIAEARRVLRKGGKLMAATICRHASLFEAFWHEIIRDPEFEKILRGDLKDGNHFNHTGNPFYFTDAHFHTQQERDEEFAAAGFSQTRTKAIEGLGWLVPDFETRWSDEPFRAKLLEFIRLTETHPEMIGISAHVMTIGEKVEG